VKVNHESSPVQTQTGNSPPCPHTTIIALAENFFVPNHTWTPWTFHVCKNLRRFEGVKVNLVPTFPVQTQTGNCPFCPFYTTVPSLPWPKRFSYQTTRGHFRKLLRKLASADLGHAQYNSYYYLILEGLFIWMNPVEEAFTYVTFSSLFKVNVAETKKNKNALVKNFTFLTIINYCKAKQFHKRCKCNWIMETVAIPAD